MVIKAPFTILNQILEFEKIGISAHFCCCTFSVFNYLPVTLITQSTDKNFKNSQVCKNPNRKLFLSELLFWFLKMSKHFPKGQHLHWLLWSWIVLCGVTPLPQYHPVSFSFSSDMMPKNILKSKQGTEDEKIFFSPTRWMILIHCIVLTSRCPFLWLHVGRCTRSDVPLTVFFTCTDVLKG